LIFAERLADRSEYLARLQLADLALDPFPYNSHSTGVDALLAGVPMVTKRGSGFPGRVGASLLLAAGLPELLADDDEGYLRTVLELHGDRERLAAIRHRLSVARSGESKSPLFDMPRFVADLEERFFAMARHALDLSEGRPLSASAPRQSEPVGDS
jgi:predicted O-linked N-acetylglucosamine transferase (SPINDLY family)